MIQNINELIDKIAEHYSPLDLDDHVHTAKSTEGSDINNAGIDAQIRYLVEFAGQDWVEEVFLSGDYEEEIGDDDNEDDDDDDCGCTDGLCCTNCRPNSFDEGRDQTEKD